MPANVLARIPRKNLTVCPMSQFNCVGAIGVGEKATGDLTAQMPGKVSAVHVIYLPVWMVAGFSPRPGHREALQLQRAPVRPTW